jgi:hypothetical protein
MNPKVEENIGSRGKRRSLIFISALLIVVGTLLIYRALTYPARSIADAIPDVYEAGDPASKENYASEYSAEVTRNMNFPPGQVHKAVSSKGFFSLDKTLSHSETNTLLHILNDTASYRWGEIGTFIADRHIVFYDSAHNPIGITLLEEEGGSQSYSYPYLKRMKWCQLTREAMDKVNELAF